MADASLQEQTKVALASIDKRLDGMNEFRASLEDVTNRAVSRDIFDIVTNRVTVIENTYLQKAEYKKDTDSIRERLPWNDTDHDSDVAVAAPARQLDKTQVPHHRREVPPDPGAPRVRGDMRPE